LVHAKRSAITPDAEIGASTVHDHLLHRDLPDLGIILIVPAQQLLDPASVPERFSRWGYEATVFIPVVITLAIGVLFGILGASTRREQVDLPIPGAAAAAVGD